MLYADFFTESIVKSLRETHRRRIVQQTHNTKHGITPEKAFSNIKTLEVVKTDDVLDQQFDLVTRGKVKRLKKMTKKEKEFVLEDLKKQMDIAIKERDFTQAAFLRDQIKELLGEEEI